MSTSPIEYSGMERCRIKTAPGKKVVQKGQVIPQALRRRAREYIKDLERRSASEWRNPIREIEKPNGGLRVVSNIIGLNGLVEKDPYSLANIREVIQATRGWKWFTVIDLKEGFYQIEIEESDKHKTAFEFEGRVYERNSKVMGFKNTPQILQRVMEGLRGNGVEVYMDDIIVHAKTAYEHDRKVEEVFRRQERYKKRVNLEKIQFREQEVKLLGEKINGEEQTLSEIKKNEVLEYLVPKNVTEQRRFLGQTGWFRQFIKDYAKHTSSQTEGLKKREKTFTWTAEMKSEFEKVKGVLREKKSLTLPDYSKEFMLRTDASDSGQGAVLLQENADGKWEAIQWASKKLTPTERRYGITEKEKLAVFWGMKKFEYEQRARRFIFVTDHKALEEIRRKRFFNNNRKNRRIEGIQEYDFEVRL